MIFLPPYALTGNQTHISRIALLQGTLPAELLSEVIFYRTLRAELLQPVPAATVDGW